MSSFKSTKDSGTLVHFVTLNFKYQTLLFFILMDTYLSILISKIGYVIEVV